MRSAPPNAIGWTKSAEWEEAGPDLAQTLVDAGVTSTIIDLPSIAGLGGAAYLTCYTSPLTGLPVTVLCLPVRYDVDLFGEHYRYFEGTDEAAARQMDWPTLYGQMRDLLAEHHSVRTLTHDQ